MGHLTVGDANSAPDGAGPRRRVAELVSPASLEPFRPLRPAPDGGADVAVQPEPRGAETGDFLLPHDRLRREDDPGEALREFFVSVHDSEDLAGWDRPVRVDDVPTGSAT